MAVCRPHAARYPRTEPAPAQTTLTAAPAGATRAAPLADGGPGFAPAPADDLRRVALGQMSATAAAREHLRETSPGHSTDDVNRLAAQWHAHVHTRRVELLGARLTQYEQRVQELVRSPMSTPAAEAMAFTELAPDAAATLGAGPTAATPAAAAAEPITAEPAATEPVNAGTAPTAPTRAGRFQPQSQDDLAPSGEVARIRANLAALRTLRAVQAEARPATADEQRVLARWSGWGAVPAALDPTKERYAWVRAELAALLDERELTAARRTVINAHYTDAGLVQAIWDGVGRLGFTGGLVLEPGCGSGNFIAFAPDGADITGVELDPTTAAIAATLHPHAQILAESFADTGIRTGSVDLTVGNVPFGDVRLHDKRDNPGHHTIHNHFIRKSLRATRPGGLVAVITSAYTMDAANPAARREMQQMADLVGAVRLPSKAHARAAGTDALTDVLIFRRREEGRAAAPFDWEYTAGIDVDGVTLRVNAYFVEHPQQVLGRFAVGDGLYRHDEISVAGDPAAAPAQLRGALSQLAAEAERAELTMTAEPGELAAARPAALLPGTATQPDGYLRANPDGTFSRLDDGAWEDYKPPKTQAAELRALLGLRDTAVALLGAEAASLDDTDDIERLRAELNTRYDHYAATFAGPINRFTERPARRKDKATGTMVPAVDEETGEPLTYRERPRQGGFRHDPFAPVVRALEVFDEETQTAAKADIFAQRVVAPRPPRLGADTPADALAICLDDNGEVRLPTVAWLLGVDEAEARQALGTLVFDDPETGRLEPAAAYLSGDVKTKLAIARAATDDDDKYAVNVAALTEVVPRDLGPDEIVIKMGAPWIDAAYVQQFLAEILDDPTIRVEHGGGAMWTVESDHNATVAARSTWGTDRRSAAEIAQHILEQREFVIKDTVGRKPNQRHVVNVDAIMAASEKAAEMRERFADWVWEDADRAAALVATYNDTFQRNVPRSYDDVRLSLPGLAMTFKPDPHQIAAVARIIHEPAVGLYHSVGAGKTAAMVMAAMELRRLGLARKPVIVVPNQLLDAWTREFLRLYPQAKVLAASTEDLAKDRRRLMVARMATGDWDAVILTEDAFEMLPMAPDAEQAYVDRQLADLEERISEARANGAELTLKRLQTKLANRQARLEGRLDTNQDAGIWWELTGIDYIFRDESHRDKNLNTVSNISGMSIKGSQRAQQMDMKLAWLRERQPRWGTRATGTPIANSIVELFTEYRFLRPDLMAAQGITDVDSFLATYAEGELVIEVTPDGGGLRNKTRFKFVNLDELITTTRVFADVKTKDDLGLQRPPLAVRGDGQRAPDVVLVQPSAELLDKVAELVARAAALKGTRPEKGGDNILKIGGEGSAAALDLRLAGLSTEEPQKLDVAADRIAGYHHAHADRVYAGPDGEPHPTPGCLQLVFCDLGTPSATDPGRWTSYGHLRALLTARGIPREKVRFIHDAKDDKQRAELFAACRDGRVAVLIGSTEKMGTGVNVQDRLLALHHLDCPWRPCDLEQREGRIDRRGNQNDEIHIERYVTERSLDAFRWQKVAYKARLADQILRGQAGREAEDIGESTLSYEEMKAAATGNPLLVDHAKAKADLTRLERLERGHHRNRSQLQWTIRNSRQEIGIQRALIAETGAAITRRRDTRGDAFAMTVRGHTHTKRAEANDRLRAALGLVLADPRNRTGPAVQVGEFGGFTITAKAEEMFVGTAQHRKFVTGLRVWLDGAPGTELRLLADDLGKGDVVTRLDNRLAKLETVRNTAAAEIDRREAEMARAEQELAKPFRHEQALAEARARFQQLDIQVVALAAAAPADAETGAGSDDPDEDPDDDRRPQPDPAPRDGPDRDPTPTSRGVGPGSGPRPPAPAGPGSGYAAAAAGAPAGAALDEVLADPALTAAHRAWLDGQMQRLATDPRIVAAARANGYDNFRHVCDPRLEDLFVDAVDVADIGGEALSGRYFALGDAAFRTAFNDAASRALYERARAAAAPTPAGEPDLAARPAAPDSPGADEAAPTTPDDATAPTAAELAARPAPDTPATGRGADPTPPTRAEQPGPLPETQRTRRGHPFFPPADLADTVPRLYATEGVPPADKMLHLHYFGGAHDVWLAEFDPATGEGFGYISLGDPDGAEWGYVSLPELETVNAGLVIIERDLYWTAVPAGEANLPGWRAPTPRPQAVPTAAAASPTTATPAEAPPRTTVPVAATTADPDASPPGTNPAGDARLGAAGRAAAPAPLAADTLLATAATPADSPPAPAQPPSRASRIRLNTSVGLVVTGTTGAPREEGLRRLLKRHGFRYRGGEWRHAGRVSDRAAATADIQRWLAAQEQAESGQARTPAPALPPTGQQQRIIDAFQAGQTVAVQALAGTGKTATLLMLAAARPQARIAYIAFNRSIADEAQRKFGRNVRADTSHAFAREGLAGTPLRAKVNGVGPRGTGARWPEDWTRILGIAAAGVGDQMVDPETIARLVMGTVRNFRESADHTIAAAHLPPHLPPALAGLAPTLIGYATAAWNDICDPAGALLFEHDDYLKIWALGNPRLPYDVVLFDEAQDINPVLRKVIQDQPTQTIVVGDSNQSIYGFRGAIDALRDWPADVTLPLTQSWRFGPTVAEVGNQFLTLLGSRWLLTGNPALASTIGPVERPDAVLARTNAGAVAAVFDAFDAGQRVALVGGGRAIEDIAKAAKDLQAGRGTKHPELARFADWDEVLDYINTDEHAQSLRAFVRLVDRRGADALLDMVKELVDEEATTSDGAPAYDVIVSTAHKAKGREWNQVRIAEDFPQPKEDLATKQVTLPNPEELRLAYVTVTRAKQRLELGSLSWVDEYAPHRPAPTDAPAPVAAAGNVAATLAAAGPANTAEIDGPVDPDLAPAADPVVDEPALTATPRHVPAPLGGGDVTGMSQTAAGFSAVEQALIRNAVADHAARYYGGPLGLGRDSAARYTSEGHLGALVDRHGLSAVWEAVAAVINADPTVLHRDEAQRTQDRDQRQAHAERLATDALTAAKSGDHARARQLVDEAELVDPSYEPGRSDRRPYGANWDEIRQAIIRRAEAAPAPRPPGAAATGLDRWLAGQPAHLRDGLPAASRRWIEEQITAMAADPAVIRAAATAGHADDLAALVDRRLFDRIKRVEGRHLPEARSGRFFTYYRDHEPVRRDLHTFARQAVYQAIRGADEPPADQFASPGAVASDAEQPVTAARLARLDTAPGVTGGPPAPATTHTAYPRAATGRRQGPVM